MRRILAVVVIAIAFAACGGGSEEACNLFPSTCPRGGTLSACCTATRCHYKASDGTDFPCNGTDCSMAATMANAWCQSH